MVKRKAIGQRRARHRIAPSQTSDLGNKSDELSTSTISSTETEVSFSVAINAKSNKETQAGSHCYPNRIKDTVNAYFASSSGKKQKPSQNYYGSLFNAELNIKRKSDQSVVACPLVQGKTVPKQSSTVVEPVAQAEKPKNSTNQEGNKSAAPGKTNAGFSNPSTTAQVLKQMQDKDLKAAGEASHPNKCIACLNKCCRVCGRRRRVTTTSDYVVKLDPELKDRMTSTLDTTRDYFHSLEATLKATMASKNQSLIQKMEVKVQLHDIFAYFENAVYLLHRVHFFCGDAIRTLSYYFEQDMTPEKLHQVQGRSALGSYMWLITLCMQAIHSGVDKEAEEFDEIKRTLEDIVGQSFVIWRGITHIVGAFIDCRKKTESILQKYLEPWDPEKGFALFNYANIDEIQKMPHSDRSKYLSEQQAKFLKNEQELKQARRKRLKQLKLHNKVGDNELIQSKTDPDGPLPPPPEVKIVRCRIGEEIWVQYKDIRNVDRLLTLNQLTRKVVQIMDEVHGHLQGMDKFLHLFSNGEDTNEPDLSYLQAVLRLKKFGKKFAKIHPSKLTQQDLDSLALMSRALIDEMDLTEFLIMTLRSLVHETRHAIHVSYEYTRLFYPRSLLKYEFISPPDHAMNCLEKLNLKTVFEDYEFDTIDFRSAVTQFNTSQYIEILKVFPVKEVRHSLMLK